MRGLNTGNWNPITQRAGGPAPGRPARISARPAKPAGRRLEVDRRVESDEAGIQNRRRPQVRRAACTEGLVERGARVRVEQVVEIESHVRTRPAKPEDFGDTHVD